MFMDIIRLIGVAIIEYPQYLLSSKYDYSRFWNKCIRINTLYTKVLQAIAVNYVSDNFYFHFNNIPYEECEIPIIEHITPTNVIGTGMISIVYEGVDKEGKVYVIKAKRKGIDVKVIDGLQQIKNILYLVKWVPYNIFNIDYIFTQFEKSMLDQLSFENEIKNHKIFKKNNEYNSIIVVPTIYEELCTSTQIVMSKIEGTHYSTLPDELISKYAKELIEMTAKNLIMDGFIHSDLHAGNIKEAARIQSDEIAPISRYIHSLRYEVNETILNEEKNGLRLVQLPVSLTRSEMNIGIAVR